jgi:hypothetical protein
MRITSLIPALMVLFYGCASAPPLVSALNAGATPEQLGIENLISIPHDKAAIIYFRQSPKNPIPAEG